MTTITPILTGVAAHIGTYADAVAVSGDGTQIFVSGTPGLREDGTRRVDTDVAVSGTRRTGLALPGASKDPVAQEIGRPTS